MNDGIGGVYKRVIVVVGQPESLAGKVSAKNTYSGIKVFEEFGKLEVQLQGLPEAFARFLLGARSHQQIQGVAIIPQQPGDQIAAEIAGRAGYEDRHKGSGGGADWEVAEAQAACADQSSWRGARASSGRPSMSG